MRALYPSIRLTPGGWQRCDASTLHATTLGNPSRRTFCSTERSVSYRTAPVDLAGKPMAEIASGKLAVPFMTLSNMVLSHASDDGAAVETKGAGASKSLVGNLKSMLSKPKAQAA